MHDHATVLDAVRASRLDGLRRMRDQLAMSMDAAEPSVQAQLAAQLSKVMADIEAIEQATPEVSESDRIARQLADGLADASVVPLAGRRRKQSAG